MIDHADTQPLLIHPEDCQSEADRIIYEQWLDDLYWELRAREDLIAHDLGDFYIN